MRLGVHLPQYGRAASPEAVRRVEEMVEQEILKNAPGRAVEKEIAGFFQDLARLAKTGDKDLEKELQQDQDNDKDC